MTLYMLIEEEAAQVNAALNDGTISENQAFAAAKLLTCFNPLVPNLFPGTDIANGRDFSECTNAREKVDLGPLPVKRSEGMFDFEKKPQIPQPCIEFECQKIIPLIRALAQHLPQPIAA